jgi:hypothetical protein
VILSLLIIGIAFTILSLRESEREREREWINVSLVYLFHIVWKKYIIIRGMLVKKYINTLGNLNGVL